MRLGEGDLEAISVSSWSGVLGLGEYWSTFRTPLEGLLCLDSFNSCFTGGDPFSSLLSVFVSTEH